MKAQVADGNSELRSPRSEVRSLDRPGVRTLLGIAASLAVLLLAADLAPAASTVRVVNVTEVAGRETEVPVQLIAQGTENALSFSLSFDPALLTFLGDATGAGAAGASVIRNTNQLPAGRLGYVLARPYGQNFAAGTNELLRLRFQLGQTVAITGIAFTNSPVLLETVDEAANILATTYSNSIVSITPLFVPGIVTQPQGRTVQPIAGIPTNITLSVTATGSPPLFYQWRAASTPIATATFSSLTLSNVTTASSGSYDAVVSNSGGAVASAVAAITVLPAIFPPAIVTPPQSWVASAGETVLFSVTASGTEPLLHQWRFNGIPLAGETNRTLVLSSVTTNRSGNYAVTVTNLGGAVTSANASLVVAPSPRMLRVLDRSVATSAEVDVPVELAGLGDENAAGFSLSFDSTRLNFVSAALGGGASDASLLVNTNELPAGRVGVALVRGTGDRFPAGMSQLALLRFRALNTSGPTPLTFTNRPIALEIADVWGTPRPLAISHGVVTVLSTSPAIVTQPQSATNLIFTTAQFTVTATGSAPLSYQWQFNGAHLAGQTQAALTLTSVRPNQAGAYRVVVTNPVAAVTSSVAMLSVPRVVRVAGTNAPTGNLVEVPLQLLAAGDENAAGFSLRFDPARLNFREVVSNSWPAGAALNLNTNGAVAGALGCVVAQNYGSSFAVGTQQLAVLRFLVGGSAGNTALSFADTPVARELVDNSTAPLLTEYQPGVVAALLVPPVVTLQPAAQSALQGTPVSFSVAARGSLPLAYQWQRNGVNLPGQTNPSLALPNVLLSDAGAYSCRIGNSAGMTNSASAVLNVLPPPADLFVTRLVAPAQVVAGEPVALWWTVTNVGTQTAQAPWQDAIFVADNPQGQGAHTLGTFTFLSALATNQWLNHTGVVILPPDLAGTKYFGVMVDSTYQVPESNETNNAFIAAAASQVRAADLSLSLLTSAATGQFGGTISVTWAVTNVGSATANGAWSDRLYLSPGSNSLAGATVLATAAGVRPLAPGAGYQRTVSTALPAGAGLEAGTWFLIAATDFDGAQTESAEGNNSAFAPILVTQPPRPDLAIAQILAPTSAAPGQAFNLIWAATNRGSITVTSLWSDTVVWSNAVGGVQELVRFDFHNGLAAGGIAWRTQAVVLPINGPAGAVWLGVQTDALGEVAEENEANNVAFAANATTVPLLLTLQLPFPQVAEDAANPLFTCTVLRNGDPAMPLTVSLTSSDTNEVTVPASVILAAGQSSGTFQARVVRDFALDGPKTVTLGATAAGFTATSQLLTVLDADLPRLTLTLTTNAAWEGDGVGGVITRDLVTTNPLTVALQSSSPGQLSPPAFVTIPGGAAATNFAALAVDDNLVEGLIEYSLSAAAAGFNGATTNVVILDNDLPAVVISLASGTVSEGAGPQATVATVTRSLLSARALAVDLESTNPAAALVPVRVTIPANQLSASFPVAAVNDAQMSGPKTTLIRPFVLASGSTTRLIEGTGAALTVTDDDGPTLTVVATKSVVAEGQSPATTLTISRNTPATNALAITLASSDTTEATVPPDAVIPAGTNAIVVPLASLADGTNDGNHSVVITASAAGFVAGTETVVVSDAELPDLVVASVSAPAVADTDTYISVSYRVSNQGLGPAGTNFVVRVYLAKDTFGNDKVLAAQAPFEGTIPVGLFFEQALQVRLPQAAGDYWIVVEVDTAQQIAEILEDNNTTISATPVAARAAYSAWVQTPLTTALANTPVPLSGRATNALGAGVPARLVNLHILVRGTERVISALTDSLGHYATTWQPLPGEAGFYQIFATHPGVSSVPVQDEFRLVGLRAEPASAAFTVVETATRAGSVIIENLSDLPLTGLSVSLVTAPAGLAVTASLAGGSALAGGAKTTLNYSVTPADPQSSGNALLRVTSVEGAAVDVTLQVTVEPLRPRLVATPGSLAAGMARGHQTVVEFKLANEGGVATGPITLALPPAPWLALATTNPLPALLPGETNATTITLLLTPAADLTLGAYEGSLSLNSSNASLLVPFSFRALSEAKGDLLVTAVDELTYYAVGSPNLAGASVTVRDAVTRTNVAAGVTGTNGQFFVSQLPEGYYELELTADKHTTYKQVHLLWAGRTNTLTAFLSRQVVTYTWTVEPIEIEDRYQVTIETTFETTVPVPVVTIEPAVIDLALLTAAETQILLSITNHGLIAANNTTLNFPAHPLWDFSPLLSKVGTLPARSGLTIPLIIRKVAPPGGRVPKDGDLGPCHASAYVCWELVCGPLTNTYCGTVAFPNARDGCGGTPPSGGAIGGGGGGFVGGSFYTTPAYTTPTLCDPCMAKAAFDCALSFVPYLGSAYGWAQCFKAAYDNGIWNEGTAESCLGNFLPGPVGCAWGFLRCKCDGPLATVPQCAYDLASGLFGARGRSPKDGGTVSGAMEYYAGLSYPGIELYQAVLDDPAGLWVGGSARGVVSNWFSFFQPFIQTNSAEGVLLSGQEAAVLAALPLPPDVTPADVARIAGRWNRSMTNWRAGIFEPAQVSSGGDTNFMSRAVMLGIADRLQAAQQAARQGGCDTPEAGFAAMQQDSISQPPETGVCARVKLRTEQEAVITRDAFRATLEINNQDLTRLEDISVELTVTDAGGTDRTSLFGLRPPELAGLSAVDGSGILAGLSIGTAKWVIIPASDAAPTNATQYFVSGRFRYTQGGTQLSVPLAPASITVLPMPELHVHYFHERDVFSDDPFTDAVEPSVPFNLAVMIENRGFGVARNFRLTSAQPQIFENDKGLLIDFQIIATEVAGQNLVPSLTANFGNLAPAQTAIGRWLMTSTLQGLFVDYSATFQHLDALDGVKLSLLEEVDIHEMIHLVQAGGAFQDGKPDFLVNDIPDLHDHPDTLWLSDGTTHPVQVVEAAVHDGPPTPARLEIQISAALPGGWAYLRVPEPSDGAYRLTGVRRSDGAVLPLDRNVWTTDRTFIGLGRRPIRENVLHLLDFNSTGLYTLTYELGPAGDATAPASQVATLPAHSYRRIPVSWSGTDEPGGSGIAGYDIFVSENGGAFTRWLERTTLSGSVYFGTLGSSYSFYSIALDQAGNREAAPGTPDAATAVTLTNRAPVLSTVTNQAVDEGVEFALALPASDPDPADALTFSLVTAPPGMTISPGTGLIRWSTGEGTGPSTNAIVARVQDNGDPALAATNGFTLIVREVNSPPTLAGITNRTVNEGQLLVVVSGADDHDLPPNRLLFSLRSPFPAGAAINATNGVFTWRPAETQGPSTNVLAVVVRDDGSPSLAVTQQFLVVVRDTLSDFSLSVGRTNLLAGESGSVPLTLRSSLELTNLSFLLGVAPGHLTNLGVRSLSSEVLGASLIATSATSSRLTFTLDPALAPASVRDIAALDFRALSNHHSAIVPLDAGSLLARRADGLAVTNGAAGAGRVIIVNREPVLGSVLADHPLLLLYGRPGAGYALEYRSNSASGGPWKEWLRFTLTNRVATFADPPVPGIGSFWRAFEFRAEPPRLAVEPQATPYFGLRLEGWPGAAYGIETTPAFGSPWQVWTNFTLTNAAQSLRWTNTGEPQRFFRGLSR
jgi:subtilase family serine protease